ncbi:unnamed protein product [Cuscuta campestris]|uniref:Reverse transcriptase RNase H-like domain-containing protein n=1 Tax=Cuscuta campestris TaxID=132261 RepID=A0A484N1G5_9ASTE|nr:unnamed protein product [Cuscuta campestris]
MAAGPGSLDHQPPTSVGLLPTPPLTGKGPPTASPGRVSDSASKLPIVCLTNAEKNECNKKGLCWYCDEKWTPDHNCKHCFLLLMGPDDDKERPLEDDNLVDEEDTITAPVSSPPTTADLTIPDDVPEAVHSLILDHSAVFGLPTGLPPSRPWDHRIHLSEARNWALANAQLPLITKSSMRSWRQYLLGREFVIRSDHRSLKELLLQVIQTPDQQFYVRKLMGFKFRIEYKTGATNRVADALSRRDEEETVSSFMAIAQPLPSLLDDLRAENSTLPDLKALHAAVAGGSAPPHVQVVDNLLYYKQRLYIRTSPFRALYGRDPPALFPTLSVRAKSWEVEEILKEWADLLTDLKLNLRKMQQRMRD